MMVWMAIPNLLRPGLLRHKGVAFLLALLLLSLGAADEAKSLLLSHKIGADWDEGSHQWMNFVALSADGKTVASNGAVPGGVAGMGLWTFPEGKFIRSIAGSPMSLSADFRLLATEDSVMDTEGRQVFRLSSEHRLWTHVPDTWRTGSRTSRGSR